jgi:putative tryptophan/tyrosine transport system substrate-binding protein
MRQAIVLVATGLLVLCAPEVRAQHTKLALVGYLGQSTAIAEGQRMAAFVQRLRELGWIEGQNVAIEVRWAEGRTERSAEVATEFVGLKVDVIVTAGTPQVLAAKQATSAVPIVAATMGDPISTGLITNLARPGGNVTGLAVLAGDLAGKRLEILREAVPGLKRVGLIGNIENPVVALELRELEKMGSVLGLEVLTKEIRRTEDIASAIDALKGRVEGIYVAQDLVTITSRHRINTLALAARLAVMYGARDNLEGGGLMSYGPNSVVLFRRAADYVDKILRGVKPGELPVEQPTRFELVVNLTTAKALGFSVPPALLARADEVIE